MDREFQPFTVFIAIIVFLSWSNEVRDKKITTLSYSIQNLVKKIWSWALKAICHKRS